MITSFFKPKASEILEVTSSPSSEPSPSPAKPTAASRKRKTNDEQKEKLSDDQIHELEAAVAEAEVKAAEKKPKIGQKIDPECAIDVNEVTFSNLDKTLPLSWQSALADEFKKPYWKKIVSSLEAEEKNKKQVFPPKHRIFHAFQACPYDAVKVVIIGQDPYHDDGQAEGMCFSVPVGVPIPSSLRNIYKELSSDIPGFSQPKHGHLEKWAQQGVFLLNAGLTVRAHEANSHKSFGWHTFTDAVIAHLSKQKEGIVFLLWGAFAQERAKKVNPSKHHLLKAPHPSGLSAHKGFFGCKHFSKCNELLKKQGKEPIDWQID